MNSTGGSLYTIVRYASHGGDGCAGSLIMNEPREEAVQRETPGQRHVRGLACMPLGMPAPRRSGPKRRRRGSRGGLPIHVTA